MKKLIKNAMKLPAQIELLPGEIKNSIKFLMKSVPYYEICYEITYEM